MSVSEGDRITDIMLQQIQDIGIEIKAVRKELGTVLKSHNGRIDDIDKWQAGHEAITEMERKSHDRAEKWKTSFLIAAVTVAGTILGLVFK